MNFPPRSLVAAALSFVVAVSASGDDKFAGAFMADGGGARALGMGSAFVAVADDASTVFWNPAGLLDIEEREVVAMHSERFGDLVDRDFVAYVHPLGDDRGTLGIAAIRLGIEDIPFTSHIDLDANDDGTVDDNEVLALLGPSFQDQIRYESDAEWAFFGSYAKPFGEWQIGGNVKVIRQSIGEFSSFGLGVDLGVLRRAWWRQLDVGLKMQDATTTYLSWNTNRSESINPVLVPGAAYRWSFPDLKLGLRAAGALEMHFDNRGDADQFGMGGGRTGNLMLGVEATLSERAMLRAGTHGGFDSTDYTFGAGVLISALRIDYAFAGDVLDIDENTHRVSLGYAF